MLIFFYVDIHPRFYATAVCWTRLLTGKPLTPLAADWLDWFTDRIDDELDDLGPMLCVSYYNMCRICVVQVQPPGNMS